MIITDSQNIVKPILEIGFEGWVRQGLPHLLVTLYNRYFWDGRRSGPGIEIDIIILLRDHVIVHEGWFKEWEVRIGGARWEMIRQRSVQ